MVASEAEATKRLGCKSHEVPGLQLCVARSEVLQAIQPFKEGDGSEDVKKSKGNESTHKFWGDCWVHCAELNEEPLNLISIQCQVETDLGYPIDQYHGIIA